MASAEVPQTSYTPEEHINDVGRLLLAEGLVSPDLVSVKLAQQMVESFTADQAQPTSEAEHAAAGQVIPRPNLRLVNGEDA